MKAIKKLPDLDWSETALRELAEADADEIVQRSAVAVRIRNVVSAGLIYHSLTSPPWFWFLLAKGVTIRDLIDFRRLQEEIPPGSMTGVAEDDAVAQRFAKFYGFVWTGEKRDNRGRTYLIFRRA